MKLLLVLSAVLMTASCNAPKLDVLIEVHGAKNVKSYNVGGTEVIEYSMDKKYPADDVIQEISKSLKGKGWKPLPYSFLFPKNQSSQTAGWMVFKDPPRYPTSLIYEWAGDWQNSKGDIVSYNFRYQDPYQKYEGTTFVLKPNNSNLKVTGFFMPEPVAKLKQTKQ